MGLKQLRQGQTSALLKLIKVCDQTHLIHIFDDDDEMEVYFHFIIIIRYLQISKECLIVIWTRIRTFAFEKFLGID